MDGELAIRRQTEVADVDDTGAVGSAGGVRIARVGSRWDRTGHKHERTGDENLGRIQLSEIIEEGKAVQRAVSRSEAKGVPKHVPRCRVRRWAHTTR